MNDVSSQLRSIGVAVVTLACLAGCSHETPAPAALAQPSASAPVPGITTPQDKGAYDFAPPPGFISNPTDDANAVGASYALPGDAPNSVRASIKVAAGPVQGDLPAAVDRARQADRS